MLTARTLMRPSRRGALIVAAAIVVLAMPLAWYLASPLFLTQAVSESAPAAPPQSRLAAGTFGVVDGIHRGEGTASLCNCLHRAAVTHTDHANSARVVRDTVENYWGRAANLNFTGWGTCSPGAEPNLPPGTIAIHWSDDDGNRGPWADVGYYPTKRTFVRLTRLGGDVDEATLRADTLHEFGHAIGFWHEQDHPQRGSQAPGVCPGTPKTDATVLTPFDVNSIMAWTYCYDTPRVLSPWDVIGVQNVYGPKPAGEIVGLGNCCLDIPNGTTAIGTKLQVFTCNGTSNQVWKFAADSTLRANVGGQDRCVEVPNSTVSPNSGTVLQTDICNARDNQLFELKGMELR